MPKTKFKLTFKDEALDELMAQADHRTLGIWARDCAERVMPYFEQAHPDDPRPRQALITLQNWIDTGEFSMKVIRKASLDSHAAARDVGTDNPARSAARAAGQAVATAHVRTHAVGPALYALQAIHRASSGEEADEAIANERAWQFQRLVDLIAQEGA
ncbi:MAG: hypothetical protein KC615_02735 [Anaerolineae bacterium]|nr:hypothetical protein [Anaerolineae bacterium]